MNHSSTLTLIVIAIIVLIFLSARHYNSAQNPEQPVGTIKICTQNKENCHYVDESIANAVLDKALMIAQRDESETFPTETIADAISNYAYSTADLIEIRDAVVEQQKIALTDCQIPFSSLETLIIYLNDCSN